jgi:hypothetical protein
MTKRTIKTYEEVQKKQAEEDRPSMFLGCTCSNPNCKLTWIVCGLPQPVSRIHILTSQHKRCPHCQTDKPMLATMAQIRPLLGQA